MKFIIYTLVVFKCWKLDKFKFMIELVMCRLVTSMSSLWINKKDDKICFQNFFLSPWAIFEWKDEEIGDKVELKWYNLEKIFMNYIILIGIR